MLIFPFLQITTSQMWPSGGNGDCTILTYFYLLTATLAFFLVTDYTDKQHTLTKNVALFSIATCLSQPW